MVDTAQRIAFLKKVHLFRSLDDEQLTRVAEELTEHHFGAGEVVFRQGTQADSFFLIYRGKVRVTRRDGRAESQLAVLVENDYFGEEALLTHRPRSASVNAQEESLLLALSRADFYALLKEAPALRPNLEVALESRRLARRLRFKWLRPDEVIYFLARKHEILLWSALTGPALSLVAPLILAFLYLTTGAITPLLIAALLLIAILLWGAWRWIDWSNDYYIVTNQRVVYLERVIGLYDNRQEAPLSTIQSASVETDMSGRLMDYGDVIVRTFIGRIPFRYVRHPNQAAAMVEEYWGRAKSQVRKGEIEAIKAALRQELGLPEQKPMEESPPAEAPAIPSPYRPRALRLLFSNLFRVRLEQAGTITYRKHRFVLFKQTFRAGLLMLFFLAVFLYRLFNLPETSPEAAGFRLDTWLIVIFIGFLFGLGWWVYEYIDWSNDIFQVTPDQILDIDRKPLGREERKAASLESILSTEYRRIGPLQMLLNFGTVYISVPGVQMAFEDVFDPPAVQADIDRRRMLRQQQKKEAEIAAERERMAEWLVTYHRNVEQFRREEGLSGSETKPE